MTKQTKLNAETLIVQSESQVSSDLDGETVMMNIENGEYFKANEIGSRIWGLLEEQTTPRRICDQLLEEFDIESDTCEKQVFSFLETLLKDQLIQVNV